MNIARAAVTSALALPLLILSGAARAGEFSAADVYRQASGSVVLIYASRGKLGSVGTGSIISPEGLILTNNHVITHRGGAPSPSIIVYLKPARITGESRRDLQQGYPAVVVARDAKIDLALLKLQRKPPRALPVLQIGTSERVEVGQSVAAIGHPGGGGMWTLTTGTISSIRKDDGREVFQTDTAINPGNSGGPLIDANAQLIGVNTFVRRRNSAGVTLEGLNYSIRSQRVLQWLRGRGFDVAAAPAPPRSTAAHPVSPALASQPGDAPPALAKIAEPPFSPSQESGAAPQAFRGSDGESMFGVPNHSFELGEAAREILERTKRRAESAFDELESPSIFDDF